MTSKSGTGSVSCYDPIAGRFFSPDILVQGDGNTQSFNKYSYCLNNPLKYTDPSGYAYDLTERNQWQFGWQPNHRLIDKLNSKVWTWDDWQNPDLGLSDLFALVNGPNSVESNGCSPIDYLDQYCQNASMAPWIATESHTIMLAITREFNNRTYTSTSTFSIGDKIIMSLSVTLYPDVTKKFNDQLIETAEYFTKLDRKFNSFLLLGDPNLYMAAKLIVFSELVETGGKFDLKNGSFSPEELGNVKYAYYNNVLYYYEEFGNYNYGFAANSFDIPLSLALEGAGFNEVYKYLRKKDGCPNFTNYIGFFDNYDATKSIIRGYLLLPMNYQFPNIP